MTSLTGIVTSVPFGNRKIEGLLVENKDFAVSVQQAAVLFSVPPNNAQRDIKRLLGADIQFLQISVKTAGRQNRDVLALYLPDFEKLQFELLLKGNKEAIAIARELLGLSWNQLFSDAFNTEFDRQQYLRDYSKHRNEHRAYYHNRMVKWFDHDKVPDSYRGILVQRFKKSVGLSWDSVDMYNAKQLDIFNYYERKYEGLRLLGKTHDQAEDECRQERYARYSAQT